MLVNIYLNKIKKNIWGNVQDVLCKNKLLIVLKKESTPNYEIKIFNLSKIKLIFNILKTSVQNEPIIFILFIIS